MKTQDRLSPSVHVPPSLLSRLLSVAVFFSTITPVNLRNCILEAGPTLKDALVLDDRLRVMPHLRRVLCLHAHLTVDLALVLGLRGASVKSPNSSV